MKLSFPSSISFLLLVLLEADLDQRCVQAFSVGRYSFGTRSSTSSSTLKIVLSATAEDSPASTTTADGASRKKPPSPKEILARQQEKLGLSADDDYPKLFDYDLLDNMQQMLLRLEKRVKDGPGSLSILEVEEFISMSRSVSNEMKEMEYKRLQDAGNVSASTTPIPNTIAAKTTTTTAETSSLSSQEIQLVKSNDVAEKEDREDGPGYDPSGGQGSLAKGTRNTYVIPNMDEMSPEEYQKALQQSIIDRQNERKKANGAGRYGNRMTWDYMNQLTGESGMFKKEQDSEEES